MVTINDRRNTHLKRKGEKKDINDYILERNPMIYSKIILANILPFLFKPMEIMFCVIEGPSNTDDNN